MSAVRVAAIVLAAGAGARMGGRAKAALALPDGRTFLAAILDGVAAAGCVDAVVVVAEPHAVETRAAAQGRRARFVDNPRPEGGMISSIAIAIAVLDAEVGAALIWPVDHPLASAAAVVGAATRASIAIPRHAGRGGHPTAFGAGLFAELSAARDDPHGARAVVRRDPRRVLHVDVDDPAILIDVDTPADYDRIKRGRS